MNRRLTALFAALEALLVVGIGIGISLVPLTLMWAFQYGLQVNWLVFWRTAVDIWLLGHGVDLQLIPPAEAAGALALPGATTPFALTIAPLTFAVITVALGLRAGRRIGETPYSRTGQLSALAVFGSLAFLATQSASFAAVQPSIVQATILPTVVFALGIGFGARLRPQFIPGSHASHGASVRGHAENDGIERDAPSQALLRPAQLIARLSQWVGGPGTRTRSAALAAVAGGLAATSLVIASAAVTVAILLAVNYARIIAIYEGVHSGLLGGVALTLGQLAFIPNTIVWAAAWFVGPGFSVGTGSAISPLGTFTGPLPAIPILGALPNSVGSLGFLWLLVPVLAGFVAGLLSRRRLAAAGCVGLRWIAIVAGVMGLTAGVLLGGFSALSGGAAGPGRLADVGSSWLLVGLWFSLEVAVPAAIAIAASRINRARIADGPSR